MEEGELPAADYDPSLEWPGEPTPSSSKDGHSAAYEWPGSDGDASATTGKTSTSTVYSSYAPSFSEDGRLEPVKPDSTDSPMPTFRLLVLSSPASVLPPPQRLALISPYKHAIIGRDRQPAADMPLLRLKEMAVSKVHASIFWDVGLRTWSIVDMGSMHGTFVAGARLSDLRTASVPRSLRHGEQIKVGSTELEVHIHDGLPCARCSPSAPGEEITLFETHGGARASITLGKIPLAGGKFKNSKLALNTLKRDLLTKPGYFPPARNVTTSSEIPGRRYIDRSAQRRALAAASPKADPLLASMQMGPPLVVERERERRRLLAQQRWLSSPSPSASTVLVNPPEPSVRPTVSAPAIPLEETNVGHRLLRMQGWAPGTALGQPGAGRVDPLELNATVGRAGIGTSRKDAGIR